MDEKIFKPEEEVAMKRFFYEDGIMARILWQNNIKEQPDDKKIMMDYAEFLSKKVKDDTASGADYRTATKIIYVLSLKQEVGWIKKLKDDFYLKIFEE